MVLRQPDHAPRSHDALSRRRHKCPSASDLAPVLLRWRISLRPNHGGIGQRLEVARDAKVYQLSLPIPGHHDIGRLQIAVNDRRLQMMEIFKRIEHL